MESSKAKDESNVPDDEEPQNTSGPDSSSDDGEVEMLRRYLAKKLGIFNRDEPEDSGSSAPEILSERTLDGVVKFIKDGKCKKLITMAGAGISTSAGIPDFRSPGSGLYHNLEKYKLPDPQAIFEIGFFQENPQPFFTLAKELYPGSFKPTVCHYFIKLLEEKGYLLRHYTQNIDTLERVAGLSDDKLVEAHGTFHTSHCVGCRKEYTLEWMKEKIFADVVPTCEKCSSIVKPDIVFFGENLPEKFYRNVESDFSKCDLLIVLGSSLAVQPFASLIDRVSRTCPRLLLNREKAGHRNRFMALMGMGSGMDFDLETDTRDVLWLGDCDEGCQLLADKLGWGEELKKMVKDEHDKIDSQKEDTSSKNKVQDKDSSGK